MAKNLVFNFDEMGGKKDAATRAIVKYFSRAGTSVVQSEVSPTVKRTAGISYREMTLTFADSQVVTFMIKQSGDIYQVKLNGKLFPIKNQDDHGKAIAEIVRAMDSGRAKFQSALAKVKTTLPAGIRTAAPKMEALLQQKIEALDEAINTVKAEIEALA